MIVKDETGTILASKVQWANNFFSRLKGLMFRKEMDGLGGIILYPCNSIHTFFMKFPIDILALNEDMIVIKQINSLAPGSIMRPVKGAKYIIELPENTLKQFGKLIKHKILLCES